MPIVHDRTQRATSTSAHQMHLTYPPQPCAPRSTKYNILFTQFHRQTSKTPYKYRQISQNGQMPIFHDRTQRAPSTSARQMPFKYPPQPCAPRSTKYNILFTQCHRQTSKTPYKYHQMARCRLFMTAHNAPHRPPLVKCTSHTPHSLALPGVPNIISYSHNATVKHLKRHTNITKCLDADCS